MKKATLDGATVAEKHPGLSQRKSGALVEAAEVVLDRHHRPPIVFEVDDAGTAHRLELAWKRSDERARRAWNDATQATEWAAETIAIVAIESVRGLVVVDRAARGSRTDYHVGQPGDGLETAALLEVAGRDDCHDLSALLDAKKAQAAANPDRLPAVAVVVRFARPSVMIGDA